MTEETLEPVETETDPEERIRELTAENRRLRKRIKQMRERCSHQQKGGIFKNYFLRRFNRNDLNYRLFLLNYLLHHGRLSPRLPDPGRVR